ncbi:cytochrome c-type biogenesis protein CcmF [bacterium BMS3Abin03]|nr:cytochrome c-type biogenesis protein CcmF [bacterium BMS3Abin03]
MLGNILIVMTILTGVFTLIMYYYTYKGYANTLSLARNGYYIMTSLVVAASALLLYYILSHQFQYSYVFEYSSKDLSFGLLLSTFFAGQEGSFLLWLLFTALLGIFLIKYLSDDTKKESAFMLVYTLAALFLVILINPLLKNPFAYIWQDPSYLELKYFNPAYYNLPELKGFLAVNKNTGGEFIKIVPELKAALSGLGISMNEFLIQGKGLNPLLQNFWMQIHPPLLFVGFAMTIIPYSFAISAIIRNEYKSWIKESLPWLAAAMMVLGFAIMVGGYWAYGVLGWGGFWGWDPVENSSLVPWIIGVAAIHTMLIQRRTQKTGGTGKYIKTNLVLSILTFVFVIYSTFLTRSGILSEASVHSFVDPGMLTYLFLLGFILTFTILGIGGVLYRWKELKVISNGNEYLLSRESGLIFGAALLIGSAIIITVGTSAPIFGSAVDVKFYNQLNLPIAILITILISLSLFLKWKSTVPKDFLKQISYYMSITAILTTAVVLISPIESLINIIFTFAVLFTITVNVVLLIKTIKVSYINTGGHLAHIGVGVFLLGVLLSGNYTISRQLDLPIGQNVKFNDYQLKFIGHEPIEDGNKFAFNVEVNDGDKIKIASPVMFSSEFNNNVMREPDILEGLSKDFYISPLGFSEGGNSDNSNKVEVVLEKGESVDFNNSKITFSKFSISDEDMSAMLEGKDFEMGADLSVEYKGDVYASNPHIKFTNDGQKIIESIVKPANIKLAVTKIDATGSIDLIIGTLDSKEETGEEQVETLTVEASIKPNINLVWLGVLLITIGFIIAALRRRNELIGRKE